MAMEGEGDEAESLVVGLIEKATNSTEPDIDRRLLKAIKSVVRYSDFELRIAAQTLMSLMKRDHSQVRYLALLIIDELFMRSKLFRTLLVENLDQLLTLSVGFRRNHPLPAPATVANLLRSKAIEFLEKWNESFGIQYRQLRLGYDYLKNTLRYQFPNLRALAAQFREERLNREKKTKEILQKKVEALKANLSSTKENILSAIDEIGQCLDILRTDDEDMTLVLDEEEMEEFRNTELRELRLDSLKEAEKVHESSENEVVCDALRELYKVLVTKHLAGVQEWISVLLRAEVNDSRFRDSTLKELIDIQNLIYSTKRNCEESGCDFSKKAAADEEDIWEDGITGTFEEGKSGPSCSKSHDQPSTSTTNDARDSRIRDSSNKNEKSSGHGQPSSSSSQRSELLAEAPVLNWGSDLHNWGSKSNVMANQRGLDVESHWGRVDHDAIIPSEKISELNVRASIYKENPIEIQPCRAPLPKGGLCQRRDLKICPFHGPIIQRDDEGKTHNESPLADETAPQSLPEELNPNQEVNGEIVEQILKQAVKNVRQRDAEEEKRKVSDKRAMRKAKLAKVREHNDSVLRDAALASTWRSNHVGEDREMGSNSRSSTKARDKKTLASMLKKKETAKSRTSRRLSSGRVRESTIRQLTVAQDANYREAFPNQW